MDTEYDVIVIGGGPAGENAAGRSAAGGLRTALVESELVGGECSYWGCIPSKTLIRPSDVLTAARRVPGAAEAVTGEVDVDTAFAQRDYMTSNWHDDGQLSWLEDAGIAFLRGPGRLTGDRTVEVTSPERTTTITTRRAVVLATGTGPLIPPVPGLAEVRPWDNRDATGTKSLPKRLLVLGGGAVGAEMAQAFRRFGCEVTVIEGGPRLLGREEPFAAEEVQAAFEQEGITVITGVALSAARRDSSDDVVAVLADGRELVGDEILVAVGRRPKTADLGLESVGLAPGRYVDVDESYRAVGVDGDWLYAVGDVNGRAPLTHMGKYQARLAADVILGKQLVDRPAGEPVIPRVTFTDPQVCAVGRTEVQAREAGFDVRVVSTPTGGVAGAYTLGNGITGTSQLVVDQARGVIVGATFTGPSMQELLHSATIAIVGEVPMTRLWHAVPSFPTVSEVWLRLLEAYGL